MGKEIGRFYKNNRSKLYTPTLKKPVLLSSASHTSSASNSTQTSILYTIDIKEINTNKNKNNISNTYDIHSCVTPQKNYSVQTTSPTTHLTPLNTKIPIASVKLHTTTELYPAGKEYLCFQIKGNYSHANQCVKSRITNKAINYILYIDTFEQQCVVIKVMLQLPRFEDHMKTIGIGR